MISFRSVKTRLTLWYSCILAFFLIVFSGVMLWIFAEALYRDTDSYLLNESRSLEESLGRELARVVSNKKIIPQYQIFSTSLYFDPEVKAKLILRIRKWEEDTKKVTRSRMMIRVMGLDHTPLVMNLKPWEKEVIFPDFERDAIFMETGESFQTIHFRQTPVRLYYRLVHYRDVPLLVIECGNSLAETEATLTRFKLVIFISIPLAVLASFFAGRYMASRAFRPLDLMIREANKISGTDLKQKLPRTHTGDELDRLAETLNEMMDRIDASKRVIQEFSSNITHELKTPLAIIRGEIDVATRRNRPAEDLVKSLRVIEGETIEMIRMVDDLIFLVRTDARQLRYEMSDVSISEILNYVVAHFKDRAHEKKIHLNPSIEPSLFIKGDPVYLKRVFTNLIDNALKFTPEKGKIVARAESQGKRIVVSITDTGMGIEPEKLSKVFSRFYRTDAARKFEGSGLGLNIVKAISDAHRAKIDIQSTPQSGTTVSIAFPAS